MKSHLFYSYAALLFGLGLMEVATMIPYNVNSIAGGGRSDGRGIFAYLPYSEVFIFIGGTYRNYTQMKNNVMQASTSPSQIDYLVLSRVQSGAVENNLRLYQRGKINSFSYIAGEMSLKFRYENVEQQIECSNDTVCEAIAAIFAELGITPGN